MTPRAAWSRPGRRRRSTSSSCSSIFFFQAEDGIRDLTVTGVQTCALPISDGGRPSARAAGRSSGWKQLLGVLDQLLRIKRLPDEALRAPSGGLLGRLLVDLAAEHHDGDRADSVPFLYSPEHFPPIDLGHHHVEQDQVRRDFVEHSESFFCAAGLAHRVALHLEVDAHVLTHSLVVVDDQDERALLHRAARAGAVEEVVEVGPAIAAMPARRIERGPSALIGPLPNRALGDAPGLRGPAERQPRGIARRSASSWKLAAGLDQNDPQRAKL